MHNHVVTHLKLDTVFPAISWRRIVFILLLVRTEFDFVFTQLCYRPTHPCNWISVTLCIVSKTSTWKLKYKWKLASALKFVNEILMITNIYHQSVTTEVTTVGYFRFEYQNVFVKFICYFDILLRSIYLHRETYLRMHAKLQIIVSNNAIYRYSW